MSETPVQIEPEPAGDIPRLAEHVFRHEAGKLVSVLTGIFGIERLQMAEDVVQESLLRALQRWPYFGIPDNPAAWITQTAKNLALDLIRREHSFRDKEARIIATIEQWAPESASGDPHFEHEIRDGRLRLMFACCHPLIPQESQTALALKTLCGFSPAEIAKSFLTTEAAIAKRLTRARARIQELQITFEIPAGPELPARLDGVLQTIYLLFNEGYKASMGEHLIKEDLCQEAIRLCALLAEHPMTNQPRTHALLALMLFNAARLSARIDPEGNILRLQDQDRALWDRAMIGRGIYHLSQSAQGDRVTAYHVQAGIAACHCMAPDFKSTDWARILSLYDQLVRMDDSPVVALNRAVAVARVHGPRAGLEAVQAIGGRAQLESYYLFYAVLGELEEQMQDPLAAAGYFRRSVQLTEIKSEQAFLMKRFRACEAQIGRQEYSGQE